MRTDLFMPPLKWAIVAFVTSARADGMHVCPRPCYDWHPYETSAIGPAMAEPVCYFNTTCFHLYGTRHCKGRWNMCLRADDEED